MGRGHHRKGRGQRITRCKRCKKPIPIGWMKKHWRDFHVPPGERRQ